MTFLLDAATQPLDASSSLAWVPWWFLVHFFRWTIFGIMALVILRRRLSPSAALAWLGLCYFLPEFGAIIYLLVGDHRLGRKRLRLHRQMIHAMRADAGRSSRLAVTAGPKLDAKLMPLIRQAERTTGMPLLGGNSLELMPDNKTMTQRLISDIDAAQRHVHLLYYIYEIDDAGRDVSDALVRAQKRGVTCRLMADGAGSWNFFRSPMYTMLLNAGVRVEDNLPVVPWRRGLSRIDLRNHRKLAVLDGHIAYTGSQNITNDTYGPKRAGCWVDMSGRFTGPIVTELQTVFVEDWAFESKEILGGDEIFPKPEITGDVIAQAVPTGPGGEAEALPRVMLAAINMAHDRVLITSPYLVPDEPMLIALAMAVDRGAEVTIVVPEDSDHWLVTAAARSYYQTLMESGVTVYQHHAGLLHAKTLTVDDSFAMVGSANMDIRSFYLCFELSVLLYGAKVTNIVRDAQLCYLKEAKRLDLVEWKKRPFYKTYFDNLAGLTSGLL